MNIHRQTKILHDNDDAFHVVDQQVCNITQCSKQLPTLKTIYLDEKSV